MVSVSSEGKQSITEFSVVERFDKCTLVEAKPITGRTHQIRVHALHGGNPLLGDDKYGSHSASRYFKSKGLQRLFLHAASLRVPMPDNEAPLIVNAALSSELQLVVDALSSERG